MDKILLVEDEEQSRKRLRHLLEEAGYQVLESSSLSDAYEKIEDSVNLYLLDYYLADGTTGELCRDIRHYNMQVPILFLSVNRREESKVKMFTQGADDYVEKPFGHQELIARIQALLRRSKAQRETGFLLTGDFRISLTEASFFYEDKPFVLSPREASLFQLLVFGRGNMISKGMILEKVWKEKAYSITDSTVYALINQLRGELKKLGKGQQEDAIGSQYGIGYYWKLPVKKEETP